MNGGQAALATEAINLLLQLIEHVFGALGLLL
jgi:hypothetical protein